MNCGYIRVSMKEQNEDRQAIAIREYGGLQQYVYMDKQSGKDFKRPNYKRLIRRSESGNTLIIKSIDRLGRNYDEKLVQLRIITKENHVHIVAIDMPLLNTEQSRDLSGTLIAYIVLQLLSYVAQTEREFIRLGQAEGIAIVKERGVKFGSTPMARPTEYIDLRTQYIACQVSARQVAKQLGITHSTFLRWVKNDNGL